METIRNDIKTGKFRQVYLLYGEENYLKQQYKRKLASALNPEEDTMNFATFSGKNVAESEVIDLAETMPFFADRRVILLENTGFFKQKSDKLTDYLAGKLPDYLVMVFVEDEVDKRNRLYKAAQKYERIVEFKEQTQETLSRWVLSRIKKEKKQIAKADLELFLAMTGTSMGNMDCEMEKLFSYTMGRDAVTKEDIRAVCTPLLTNRIFEMVEAVAAKKQKKALTDYYDLLAMKEPPMRILYLMARQFSLMMQIKEMQQDEMPQSQITQILGLRSFVVSKYMKIMRNYTLQELVDAVEDFTRTETDVKTGKLSDVLGVELMLIKYSS